MSMLFITKVFWRGKSQLFWFRDVQQRWVGDYQTPSQTVHSYFEVGWWSVLLLCTVMQLSSRTLLGSFHQWLAKWESRKGCWPNQLFFSYFHNGSLQLRQQGQGRDGGGGVWWLPFEVCCSFGRVEGHMNPNVHPTNFAGWFGESSVQSGQTSQSWHLVHVQHTCSC